jgi:hypothetical protein
MDHLWRRGDGRPTGRLGECTRRWRRLRQPDLVERSPGTLELQAPGLHNIQNAMAALLVAGWCDVSMDEARQSLTTFQGTARRFEYKGRQSGVTVIDDYAHHPTEVEATLAAARGSYPDARIWAVFQPHTFSRTQRMLYRMGDSFQNADRVIVTDIFAAREIDDGSVTASELVAASDHPSICHVSGLEAASDYLLERVSDGDVVITLGAGDGYKIGEMLLESWTTMTVADFSELAALGIEVRQGVSLAPLTTMKIGGDAEYFAVAADGEQLITLGRWAQTSKCPILFLAAAATCLISDAGIKGLVIYNRSRTVRIIKSAGSTDEPGD